MAKTLKEHNFFGYDATVVADSKNSFGDRVTTMVLTYPRIIHAEFMTHRMFARNSASSRAIPFRKMVERVESDPFIPIAWQRDHTGMQGTEYFTVKEDISYNVRDWLSACSVAVAHAKTLAYNKVTKQICNRLLEPFLWHTVIVTSTEWENFFSLRCPQYRIENNLKTQVVNYRSKKDYIEAAVAMYSNQFKLESREKYEKLTTLDWLMMNKSQADIHIQAIAEPMWDAYQESKPKDLSFGEWHIPFGDEIDEGKLWTLVNSWEQHRELEPAEVYYGTNTSGFEEAKIKIAVATCARISYGNISPMTSDYEADIALYDRLSLSGHASPFEHVLRAMSYDERRSFIKGTSISYWESESDETTEVIFDSEVAFGWCDNFRGFISQRNLEKL